MKLLSFSFLALATASATQLNVLMIAVDDLRPQLDCLEVPGTIRPKMITPNICKLAADSLVMERSQVAMATCGPSRAGLLTGRHAGTTRVWDLVSYWRTVAGNFTTIPQYFKDHGYFSVGMGKVFHEGSASGAGTCALCTGDNDQKYSWSEPYFRGKTNYDNDNLKSWMAVPKAELRRKPLKDTQIANAAVDWLHNISAKQPFFMAVGFHKPHLPFVFPEKYLDIYPEDKIQLPLNPYAPIDMPTIAWQPYGETRGYGDIAALNCSGEINTTLPDFKVKELRRAYYAAVSYTDANVGRVLDALDKEGLTSSTIVVFWGDHGWQLGEHGEWDKHTNFDLATHAPVMFRVPGLTENGITTKQMSSTIDIFPTLAKLALNHDLPKCPKNSTNVQVCTEGEDLSPLISNHSHALSHAAVSVYTRSIPHNAHFADTMKSRPVSNCLTGLKNGCTMGYSMLTFHQEHEIRYTEWVNFPGPSANFLPNWSNIYATEIYNHTADPAENHNVFKATSADIVKVLSDRLHAAAEPGYGTEL